MGGWLVGLGGGCLDFPTHAIKNSKGSGQVG